MTSDSRFVFIGDCSALWRAYRWTRVEKYAYDFPIGNPQTEDEILCRYVEDRIFHRSFYARRVADVRNCHGPYVADRLSALGSSTYERLSVQSFRDRVDQMISENFGSVGEQTAGDRHRLANVEGVTRQISSSPGCTVYRLRTEDLAELKHESAFILDFFVEFVLIDLSVQELQTCVVAED